MEPGALRRRLDDIYLRRREHVSPNLPETQPGREAHLLLFPTEHYGVTFKGVSPPTRSALMNGCIENRVLVSVEVACDCTD